MRSYHAFIFNRFNFTFALVLSFAALKAQCFEPDASIWKDTWASCTPTTNPNTANSTSHWIQYDLGRVRRLSKSWIWNTNDPDKLDQGFRDVKIDYSLDGENWMFWGNYTFSKGTGAAVYGGFPGPDLVGIQARYILITAQSNYGDLGCFGLAEVKFNLLPYPEGRSADGTYENCQPITDVEVEITGQTEALITWEPLPNTDFYLVEYRLIGTEEWQQAPDDYSEAFLNNLVALETYEYQITRLCASELSSPVRGTFTLSEEAICATADEVEIFLAEVGPTEAFLYWPLEDLPLANMTAMLIPEDGTPADAITINLTESEVFLQDLLPATTYEFTVSYTCGDQSFTLEEFIFTTQGEGEGICAAVGELSVEAIDYNSASFSWAGGDGTTEYTIIYAIEDDEDWTTVTTEQPDITLANLMAEELYVIVVGVRCGDNLLYSPPFYFFTEPLVSTNDSSLEQRTVKTFPNPTR
ncbi:MAG: discoidin domain-containing protein, partial [Bacteroidota bacterium]